MSSSPSHLRNIGIYRNLPTFDSSVKGLSAIITGANGISGFNMLRALLDSPERWETIYCLSRRPPPDVMMAVISPEARSRIKVVTCDFLDEPTSIAESLKKAGIRADNIFYYSYIHYDWSEAEALVKDNVRLLKNFLEALELAEIRPTRFTLQTGGKNYGVHIGRARTPILESDSQPRHLQPNFYYPQEDLLKSFCEKNGTTWNIIRPAAIIGASTNAGMNMFYDFAIYAIVQARKGEPLVFGGDWEQWQYEYYHCTARMTGYLTEWAAIQKDCANEAFNAQDGGPLSYERYFHELARWFGAKGVVPPPDDESNLRLIIGRPGKASPLGYGPPITARQNFSMVEWAKKEENEVVWREIMKESGGKIRYNPFEENGAFTMADIGLMRCGSLCLNKARRNGWTGFADSLETIFEMYREMEAFGMMPAMRVLV